MVRGASQFDTTRTIGTPTASPVKIPEQTQEQKCKIRGGTWDSVNQRCVMINQKPKQESQKPKEPKESQRLPIKHGVGGETDTQKFDRAIQSKVMTSAQSQIDLRNEQEAILQQQQQEGMALGQNVGQFNQLPIEQTPFDFGEAITVGIRNSIPRALSLAVTGAGIGGVGGTAIGPVGTVGGALIGGAAGFVSGISSGMISNFKSQRTDTTNAQKRVLDEGKQTLNDWVTLAKNDPTNRPFYLSQFNRQLALIDQAHQQMKLDTQNDVLKFESAIPDLAEFEVFYDNGGERDFVTNEMRIALVTPSINDYDFLELANRRTDYAF